MKKTLNFTLLLVTLAMLTVPGLAQAASLLEVYQQALQSDPRIHEAEARRLAALEAEPQARGVLLPQIDFSGEWSKTNSDGSGTINQFVEDPPDSGIFEVVPIPFQSETRDETTRWNFSLRQTLFRWDQIIGLRRADSLVAKAEADREAAQQDLVIRVGQTYFDVLGAEDRLTSLHAPMTWPLPMKSRLNGTSPHAESSCARLRANTSVPFRPLATNSRCGRPIR